MTGNRSGNRPTAPPGTGDGNCLASPHGINGNRPRNRPEPTTAVVGGSPLLFKGNPHGHAEEQVLDHHIIPMDGRCPSCGRTLGEHGCRHADCGWSPPFLFGFVTPERGLAWVRHARAQLP